MIYNFYFKSDTKTVNNLICSLRTCDKIQNQRKESIKTLTSAQIRICWF